ncbi:MAG: hypothetical protein LBK67_12590 [Coriobacteriales bacterium]|jgi:hypothetical protein|nr:hypothetical protein [Coriobacteriales bacterium]
MNKLVKNAASLLFVLLLAMGLSFCVLLLFDGAEGLKRVVVAEEIAVAEKVVMIEEASISAEDAVLLQAGSSEQNQQEQQQTLPGRAVPRAASLEEGVASPTWRDTGTWSLANVTLTIIGLVEALCLMGSFLYRTRGESLSLSARDFRLRLLVLTLTLAFLVGTTVTSDFVGSVVIFDKMSLPVIALFSIQQAILLGMRKIEAAAPAEEETGKQFRATKRYEGKERF